MHIWNNILYALFLVVFTVSAEKRERDRETNKQQKTSV